jgi:carboxyl-terminal processing protease
VVKRVNEVKRPFTLLALVALTGTVFAAEQADTPPISAAALHTLQQAWTRIQQHYVEPVEEQQLLHGAIRGMVDTLDPHSQFLDQKAAQRLLENTVGEYAGIGIDVIVDEALFRVSKVNAQGSASKAGIKLGDVLLQVDNTPLTALTFDKVIDLLRGDVGSTVSVEVQREGNAKPLRFVLKRGIVKVNSVNAYWLESGIAYVQLEQFQADSAQEIFDAIEKLKRQDKKGIQGLVFDLRNNPGGLVPSAVQIADYFLRDGVIVSTRSRAGEGKTEAQNDDVLNDAPMVVLINGHSASASEIVAGALQDHQRALLIGEKSYGKGSVQTVNKLDDESAIKLTTALYFTPTGRSIQQRGIEPDIEVPSGTIAAQLQGQNHEANLSHALINQQQQITALVTRVPLDDVQLAVAIVSALATSFRDYQLTLVHLHAHTHLCQVIDTYNTGHDVAFTTRSSPQIQFSQPSNGAAGFRLRRIRN